MFLCSKCINRYKLNRSESALFGLICPECKTSTTVYPVIKSIAPDPWKENKRYPVKGWQDEVTANDTRLGYLDWVEHQKESVLNE
jgi:hypothetical protein